MVTSALSLHHLFQRSGDKHQMFILSATAAATSALVPLVRGKTTDGFRDRHRGQVTPLFDCVYHVGKPVGHRTEQTIDDRFVGDFLSE
jgi:hypothetical protein